jgi:hypothetical protein
MSIFKTLQLFYFFKCLFDIIYHLDSLWLHVRASGHWTRRVYDLFRLKLKQEHGGIINDFNDLRLRCSMRSRMSKSYIDELRGTHQREMNSQIDLNNNNDNSSHCSLSRTDSIQPKSISVSFPTVKNPNKVFCTSCQSTFSLPDTELNPLDLNAFNKQILMDPNELENMTVEEIEKYAYEKDDIITDEPPIKRTTILKSVIKNNNRLTVPAVSDYCIKIPNTVSICSEQQSEFNETRLSDALGYLRMYKNRNRIQFNTLQFNDREDLQVN